MGRLDGKVAIVTGAGMGLGAAIVKRFAEEGAIVVGTARRENNVQDVMPEFEKLGKGSVVNVNSLAGIVSGDADNASAAYSASKGAGRSLTKHAAYYLAEKNVRVNSIHPGPIMTPMLEGYLKDNQVMADRVKQYNPLPPHISGPEDVANGVLYLASDEASCVTGAELVVDCGHLVM